MPTLKGSDWVVSRGVIGPGGKALNSQPQRGFGISINNTFIRLPHACKAFMNQDPLKTFSCLNAHGYRLLVSYQPASRYWAFQGIEAGIFTLIAVALIAAAAIVVLRRDA
jgi:hypothetical protein